jgi:Protein of unknown function (DUF3467)
MAAEKPKNPPIEYDPLPDDRIYNDVYANNTFFEASTWDLKVIFGQLDQRHGKNVIRQHTAVTLPWTHAKIIVHWLKGYIEFHEKINGKIIVPSTVIPPEAEPPSEEQVAADPNAKLAYEIFKKLRNELIEEQKK